MCLSPSFFFPESGNPGVTVDVIYFLSYFMEEPEYAHTCQYIAHAFMSCSCRVTGRERSADGRWHTRPAGGEAGKWLQAEAKQRGELLMAIAS